MMFRHRITVRNPDDIVRQGQLFQVALNDARLPAPTAAFLREQVETALSQLRAQMCIRHTRSLRADRLFEGDGYRIALKVRQGQEGWLKNMLSTLGFD